MPGEAPIAAHGRKSPGNMLMFVARTMVIECEFTKKSCDVEMQIMQEKMVI